MVVVLFWVFVAVFMIAAVIAIATENSSKRVNRLKYATVFASCIIVTFAMQALSQQIRSGVILVLALACAVVLEIWLVRTSVQRLRDAELPNGLAYLAIVPLANWLFNLYLLFPASRPLRESGQVPDK